MQIRSFFTQIKNNCLQFFITFIFAVLFGVFLSSCQTLVEKDSQVIHLVLWQGINPPSNREVFQKLVDKFNQTHSNIQVESIFVGEPDQQLPKILTAIVGNSPPDILSYNPQMVGKFVELDAIVPLENWWERSPIKPEISPNLLSEVELDGHLWAIPAYTSNLGIFYRHDIFQAAGITQPPQNWTQLREVAKKLTVDTNGDGHPDRHGILLPLGIGEWTVFSWFPFLLSAEGDIVQNNQPDLTNPGAIAALKFWQDLVDDGSTLLSPPERGYEEDAFLSGRVAMQITGPWTYITKSKVDYKVFPIPSDVRRATVTGTGTFFIMKTTPEKEKAAWKFMEYILGEEFQTAWSIGTGFLPVNIKSAKSAAYQEYLQQRPWLKVFVEQIPIARYRPNISGYNRLSQSLGRAIEATLLQKSSAEAALKKAQERIVSSW
jgi:multiple sugar transport system substrate-binding protein